MRGGSVTHGWSLVPLGDVLSLDIDAVPVDSTASYEFAGVYSFGRGLFYRDEVRGSETTYRVFHRLHRDQFVMSQPKGWEGALARVTEAFDGKFLSPVFPTFSANADRLDIRYLELYFKQAKTWYVLERMSKGIGARRNSVYPDMLFSLEIPLPPLPEQQRIVARIERLAAKIEEARGLCAHNLSHAQRLLWSILFNPGSGTPTLMPMAELVRLREPDVEVRPDETYHFAGVYSFGRGMFTGERRSGVSISYKKLTRLQTADFTYPKLMSWEGAFAVVPPECSGLVLSTEFPVFSIDDSRVLPEVMDVYFREPSVWESLGGSSTGTNLRRRRLDPRSFLASRFPVPPMTSQLALQSVKRKMDETKIFQTRVAADLDALLPAVLDRAFRGEL